MEIMELTFWVFIGLIFYVYWGYPILLFVLKYFCKIPEIITSPIFNKRISIIISAYNEEKCIASKIENILSLDYPEALVEIIVGSDGSTDRTNEIVSQYQQRNLKLFVFKKNRGKTAVQNDCVSKANGEIIIFMDAASLCNQTALKALVKHFEDEKIGCVAGRIIYTQKRGNIVEEGQGLYWKYEQILKRLEGKIGSLVGVDGPLYAIRTKAYIPLKPDIISDLVSPLLVLGQGYNVIFEPDAIAFEEATTNTHDEFNTRERVVLRGLAGLFNHLELFNFLRQPFLVFQLISHKILRWQIGFFFLGLIVTSIFLSKTDYRYEIFLYIIVLFCLLGILGFYLNKNGKKIIIFSIPYYFLLVNFAAIVGTLNYLMGKRIISWIPKRS